jgi:uncharacterized membrane protein required for colicin V production
MNTVMNHFTYADIIAACIILIWTVLGFKKGLSGQIAFFLSALVVITAAIFGYDPCNAWLIKQFNMQPEWARLVALACVIAIPLIIVLIIHAIAGYIVKVTFTAWIDRLGGAIAGFASATAFVVLVFIILNATPRDLRPATTGADSWIGRHLLGVESNIVSTIEGKVDQTRGTIQKAREERTGRREKWEQ